jgi:hypothetical protein
MTSLAVPGQPRYSQRPVRSRGAAGAFFLLWSGVLGAVWGWGTDSAATLSVGTGLLALSYLVFDLTRGARVTVSVMTLFAFAAAIHAFANARGLMTANTPQRAAYFVYAVDEYVMLAAQLALAGAVLPMLGFWLARRSPTTMALVGLLPQVRGSVGESVLIRGGLLAVAFVYVSYATTMLPSLGTVTALVYMIPTFVVFVFARVGGARKSWRFIIIAFFIAFMEASRALLFEYLRSGVLVPLFAFVAGVVVGQRSLKFLRSKWVIPVYVSLIIFIVAFDQLGKARSEGGVERMRLLMEDGTVEVHSTAVPQTFVSRLTNFNQLTRIGWIVEQDGFLQGETLDYLAYAFVPRFLWPDKPLIAKGSWFAVRIGQAYIRPDGRASNAVNMTIAGELYLNYGWLGVIVGCLLVGGLLAVFWSRSGSMYDENNVLGWSFAFYLLWLGLSLEQDLQFVVTLTAVYLAFVALTAVARQIGIEGRAAPGGSSARHGPRSQVQTVGHRPL